VGTLARIFIEVYGCSANMADWEMAAGLLSESGHSIVPDPRSADAYVVPVSYTHLTLPTSDLV